MLTDFAQDIWLAEGPRISAALGFEYPTRMVVIRLPNKDLFIWSPINLHSDLHSALAKLGMVRHIVAPNSLHDSFLSDWQSAYPTAMVHGAPNLAKARPDIVFHSELTDVPHPAWKDTIDQVVFHGNAITTEVVFCHRDSGTILFTDLIQHLPRDWYAGWRRIVARLDLMTEAEPAVPRKFRLATRDKQAARHALQQIKGWPVQRVVMAHGPPVETDAAGFLQRAFDWLDPSTRN